MDSRHSCCASNICLRSGDVVWVIFGRARWMQVATLEVTLHDTIGILWRARLSRTQIPYGKRAVLVAVRPHGSGTESRHIAALSLGGATIAKNEDRNNCVFSYYSSTCLLISLSLVGATTRESPTVC